MPYGWDCSASADIRHGNYRPYSGARANSMNGRGTCRRLRCSHSAAPRPAARCSAPMVRRCARRSPPRSATCAVEKGTAAEV
eukprot:gene8845-biopygen1630